jgi:hypothetical protein
MKTVQDINKLIEGIQLEYEKILKYSPISHRRKIKLLDEKYSFLKKIKLYLESSPSQEFLTQNKEDIERKIDIILENFEFELKHNEALKVEEYKKRSGVHDLKKKLKTINFILKD